MRKKFLIFLPVILFLTLYGGEKYQLTGELTRDEILQHSPDWEEVVASYIPDIDSLDILRSIDTPVQIEVYLGTWCSDSKDHVSAFFKILDMADNPQLIPLYIGLPKENDAREELVQGKNITRIPTFVVIVDGHEKGQIIEHPATSMEQDLVEIIRKPENLS